MSGIISDFKRFLLRGNVVDLAVAVVVGAAFGNLVKALVEDLLTPIVALIFGQHDFSSLAFSINGSLFHYGAFLNALIAFLSVATAVFFFVVQPMNLLSGRRETKPDPEAETHSCPECLSAIPSAATRCRFCTATSTPSKKSAK